MLKEILSIGGKPGLFKLVSKGKNMLVVESLADGKRVPAFFNKNAVSLADVSVYTDTDSVALSEVLASIYKKENGEPCSMPPKSENDVLGGYFAELLPDYDRDRVYPSDIRKIISWYNLLVKTGITDFTVQRASDDLDEPEKEAEKELKGKE